MYAAANTPILVTRGKQLKYFARLKTHNRLNGEDDANGENYKDISKAINIESWNQETKITRSFES